MKCELCEDKLILNGSEENDFSYLCEYCREEDYEEDSEEDSEVTDYGFDYHHE